MKILDVRPSSSWDELRAFLDACGSLIRCDFMGFEPSYPAECTYRWGMPSCLAFEGMRKLGFIDDCQCGICTRLECWLDGSGLDHSSAPECDGCIMHTEGHCYREYSLRFPPRELGRKENRG